MTYAGARRSLTEAARWNNEKARTFGGGTVGLWYDWLVARLRTREAEAQVAGKADTGK